MRDPAVEHGATLDLQRVRLRLAAIYLDEFLPALQVRILSWERLAADLVGILGADRLSRIIVPGVSESLEALKPIGGSLILGEFHGVGIEDVHASLLASAD
jgi:hypothetical protein